MQPTITKMQQLDAKNPGLLAILDEHLDKRKRPSWIAARLSSRYVVPVTIMDIVDYIGQKWAPKLPRPELAESGVGEETPQLESPVLAESQLEEGIAGQESGPVCHIPSTVCPSHAEAEIASLASLPVCHLPSTVYPSHVDAGIGSLASGVADQAPPPESEVLSGVPIPKAKPPRRASATPRKRRAALLELQVSLVEECLERDAPRIASLGH